VTYLIARWLDGRSFEPTERAILLFDFVAILESVAVVSLVALAIPG